MNVTKISNRILPLAASAAIGLSALTACSSSNSQKTEPDYYQTEVTKLDNTLDSLKSNKGDGVKDFFDYYDKSKMAIITSSIDTSKHEPVKKYMDLTFGGFGLLVLSGIATAFCQANYKFKAASISMAGIVAGALIAAAGTIMGQVKADEVQEKFQIQKVVKLTELELEKEKYFENTKGL